MDMFFRAASKLIYICLASFSCTPHVTSCRVGPLIAAPSWCRWLVAAFHLPPLFPPVLSPIQHLYHSTPLSSSDFFFLSFLNDQRGECHFALAEGKEGKNITLFFALSKSNFCCTAVNSSPLHDALWLPPRCILSQDRIDVLFDWEAARAWKSYRVFVFVFFPIHPLALESPGLFKYERLRR